jgi:hypothetical protein
VRVGITGVTNEVAKPRRDKSRPGPLVRGLRRQLAEGDRTRVAEAIREHLPLAGWRIEPGPGIGGHSQLSGTAKRDR